MAAALCERRDLLCYSALQPLSGAKYLFAVLSECMDWYSAFTD
jgi:hypothetical protein